MNNEESAIRERAVRARFATDYLRGSPSDPRTLTPNNMFVPKATLGTSTDAFYYANLMGGQAQDRSMQEAMIQLQSAVALLQPHISNVQDAVGVSRQLSSSHGASGGADAMKDYASLLIHIAGNPIDSKIQAYKTIWASSLRGAMSSPQREDPVIDWRNSKNLAARVAIKSQFGDEAHVAGIKSRLEDLIAIATEEYPETDIPHSTTIGAFAEFIFRIQPAIAPIISLTPGGNLVAEWTLNDGRRAAFQFLPDLTVNFSARIPDPAKRGRPMPIYGAASLSSLYQRVQDDSAFSWILGEPDGLGNRENTG